MKLHIVGIFHTIHSLAYSHCAFTGKALRLPKILNPLAQVVEYANEGSESEAPTKIVMVTKAEFDAFEDKHYTMGTPLHQLFESRLIEALKQNVKDGDIICHPFGRAHETLLPMFPNNFHLETGIGYPEVMPTSLKCYESYAWLHFHQGKAGQNYPGNYNYIVPLALDLEEWPVTVNPAPSKPYIAFLGRICADKGLNTIKAIVDHGPEWIHVKVCGNQLQDIEQWKHPRIEFVPPLCGTDRATFLGNAVCALMPTTFIEPFGGSGVEAMACGTPLIAVDYGAFSETIVEGVTGYRCHTLQDWLDNIEKARHLDRALVASTTRARYSLETIRAQYKKVLDDLANLRTSEGWYKLKAVAMDPATTTVRKVAEVGAAKATEAVEAAEATPISQISRLKSGIL